MTIGEALARGTAAFRSAGCDTPALDALVLLAAAAGRDKAGVFAHSGDALPPGGEAAWEKMLARRLSGSPVAYILNSKEFYGFSFYVDERVLVPRPDTETLVDAALEILRSDSSVRRVHDACTGTGCVAIALAASCTGRALDISASDISGAALEIFRLNSEKILGRVLPHRQGALLDGAEGIFDMITANPPYVSAEESAAMFAAGWPEPALALDGGRGGLEVILGLMKSAARCVREGGYLLLEAADSQAEAIRAALGENGWRGARVLADLGGKRRVWAARKA